MHRNREMAFDDIIYTEETTMQIETQCSYKKGYKLKPKHPLKVHDRHQAKLCIFEGKMNAPLFAPTLRSSLLPFTNDVYPDGCRFVQDNDPKHCSKLARRFRNKKASTGGQHPQTPQTYVNPIENLWHDYIRREVKQTAIQRRAHLRNKGIWVLAWMEWLMGMGHPPELD